MCLGATGKLADGYSNCAPGYDHMVLDAIGVSPDALIAFVAEKKPTYIEFEKFISANASNLNETSVASINAAVAGYQHKDQIRQDILASVGLPDGKPTDAINLNNLDDWQAFHAAEIA
jgi:hypothetical protein